MLIVRPVIDSGRMAYDVELGNRLREALAREPNVTEKVMFGGLAFMVNGNLAVSASSKGGILLRVDPSDTASLIENARAERFVMRGRAMEGWLRIDPDGLATDDALKQWVSRGVSFARALPAK